MSELYPTVPRFLCYASCLCHPHQALQYMCYSPHTPLLSQLSPLHTKFYLPSPSQQSIPYNICSAQLIAFYILAPTFLCYLHPPALASCVLPPTPPTLRPTTQINTSPDRMSSSRPCLIMQLHKSAQNSTTSLETKVSFSPAS